MLLIEREREIIQLLNQRGTISVRELAESCNVTEMTIRRDLKKLEQLNLLQRTHGGATRIDLPLLAQVANQPDNGFKQADLPTDALILAPVQSHIAHTLRERAVRSQIPLLAESAPIENAIYLGPLNYEGSAALGRWAGEYVLEHFDGVAQVLDIILQLPNTRERSAGFVDGLREVLGDVNTHIISVDGRGLYNEAYQVALDALRVHPQINVIFGINDDSVLGGLQAYHDLERDPERLLAVNVGGEGRTLFDVLQRGGALKACLALFPEIVGRSAIDGVLRLWAGEDIGGAIVTPSAVLTVDTLTDYYTPVEDGWVINLEAAHKLHQSQWATPTPQFDGKRVSFVLHFRTHEWYQNVAAAMQERADEVGISLSVEDANEDVQAEIAELRRLIGKMAASYVNDGDIIILDAGTPTASMAQYLDNHHDLTVITNSAAVFQRLQRNPNINLMMTGGKFDRESQAFVERGAQLLLREIRADKAFIVASGVSESFGISCKNLAEAEIRRAMIDAAREIVLLADHTILGADSRVRVAGLEAMHTLITDAGVPAAQRLDFNRRSIKVMVAGEVLHTHKEV